MLDTPGLDRGDEAVRHSVSVFAVQRLLHSMLIRWNAWLALACLPIVPIRFTRLIALLILVLFLSIGLVVNWMAALTTTFLVGWGIRITLVRRITARGRYVAAELPSFLRIVTSSLRSGFSLLQALQLAGREGPPLIGAEVRRVIYETNMGASVDVALERMADRLNHDEIDLFVAATVISREVGGNLAEALLSLQGTILERMKLQRQIRVLTAQARLSGMVVAVLPFSILGIISFINPGYTAILFEDPIGWLIIGISVISLGLGVWFIRRIIASGEEMLS